VSELYEKATKEAEKSLKKLELKDFEPSEIAAGSVYVARIASGFISPWASSLELLTGC